MEWRLLKSETFSRLDDALALPVEAAAGLAFAAQPPAAASGSGAADAELLALTPPPARGDVFPVGVFSIAELQDAAAWREIFALIPPIHRADLAAYQARPDLKGRFAPEVFLAALDRKANFKSVSDWREWAGLDELSRRLARALDLPLNTLRLWNRLDRTLREGWLDIWDRRVFGKNLVREIIQDLYDLDPTARDEVLLRAREFSESWQARSRPFPATEVRDMVRKRRSPHVEELRRKLFALRRDLKLPKQIQLELPADLEQTRLEVRVSFEDLDALGESLQLLADPERQAGLQKILDTL